MTYMRFAKCLCQPILFFYHIFSLCVHYHHYPSLQIVIEYPQLLLHTFSKPCWTFKSTCKPIAYRRLTLCVLQSISYSFASTISTCCSAWAWDHECHITAYDLSRQRRRSVILVYIPHEITANTTIFTDHCIMRSIIALF